MRMEAEPCGVCGGDGRIANSFSGSDARCPACLGTGRKSVDTGFRDVTKTKPSHYRTAEEAPKGPRGPATPEGMQLAAEVGASAILPEDAKARLVAEIINHESTHGRCTKTFLKKIRKQFRPAAG